MNKIFKKGLRLLFMALSYVVCTVIGVPSIVLDYKLLASICLLVLAAMAYLWIESKLRKFGEEWDESYKNEWNKRNG